MVLFRKKGLPSIVEILQSTFSMILKGKITDLCAFMSETTNLCQTLQIYVAFIKTMHEFLIFGKCCKLSNLCSIMHEIIKSMCKLSDLC